MLNSVKQCSLVESLRVYAFFRRLFMVFMCKYKRNLCRHSACVAPANLHYINVLNHGLRGSASPVLTATGFVNGRWQFSTPYRIRPLDRSPKNLVQVIMSAAPTAVPNLVQIRRWRASGQMGEI